MVPAVDLIMILSDLTLLHWPTVMSTLRCCRSLFLPGRFGVMNSPVHGLADGFLVISPLLLRTITIVIFVPSPAGLELPPLLSPDKSRGVDNNKRCLGRRQQLFY